jgi:hypothetical protein
LPQLTSNKGVTISNCILGESFVGVVDGFWVEEIAWTDNHRGHPIVHPGNGFGLVIKGSPEVAEHNTDQIWYSVSDCSIQCNRYKQIILAPNHVSSFKPLGPQDL